METPSRQLHKWLWGWAGCLSRGLSAETGRAAAGGTARGKGRRGRGGRVPRPRAGAPSSGSLASRVNEGSREARERGGRGDSHGWQVLGTHLHGHELAQESDAELLHGGAHLLGHLLVEAPQQLRAHHDRDLQAQAGQDACALQRRGGCAHHQGRARAVGQREEVIAAKREGVSRRDGATRGRNEQARRGQTACAARVHCGGRCPAQRLEVTLVGHRPRFCK